MTGSARSIRQKVGDVTLHMMVAGPESGPLVILLHGFPEFWFGWRRQIDPLARSGFRVIALDQRGYNLSFKPPSVRDYALDILARDVVGVADAFARDSFCLVGHDWGGLVAWWVAVRHPSRVGRLAILNAPHPAVVGNYVRHHPLQVLRSAYTGFFQLPWLPEAMLQTGNYALLRRALVDTSQPETFSEDEIERYMEAWSQPGALTSMLNWYRAGIRFRPRETQTSIAAETLILWGVNDPALERGLAEESLRLCHHGRVQWFDNATHWVHLEEPDRINQALVAFLGARTEAVERT